MKISSEDLRGWAKESSPIISEGYIMAADEIDRLNSTISSLRDRIIDSSWTREEQYDYKYYEICNYCEANLTKAGNKHSDDCIITEVLKYKN